MKEIIKTITFCMAIIFVWYVFFSLIFDGKDETLRWFKKIVGWKKTMVIQTETGKEIKLPQEYIEIKSVKKLYDQAQDLDIPAYNKKKLLIAISSEIDMMEYDLIRKLGKNVYLELQEQDR